MITEQIQCALLGSAMCAAAASGIYPTIQDAQKAMGNGFEKKYTPDPANVEKYKILYEKYSKLGEFVEKEITE
ncbi:MAG: hypothetical protein KAX15_03355 [Candidatus Omnitrophica bacterium]|nr:hypothetical protein [Candidatus Omnitrophota bacterium]